MNPKTLHPTKMSLSMTGPRRMQAKIFGSLACTAWIFSALNAISMQAHAASILSDPDDTLALTVNLGPLVVSAPERFELTGLSLSTSRSDKDSPARLNPIVVDQPGDYLLTLPAEKTAESRRYYSLRLSDRSKPTPIQYTLRFELMPGSCPAMAATSNNMQLAAVAGRPLSFSVLRRPAGKPNGPQLISMPAIVCINPDAVARLTFNPIADDFVPLELQTEESASSSVAELDIPL
ncbi:hypothetical protein ACSFA3_15405 [Variovorax sp. RHLX14]|uniref:hypothetical protein n=1 Tax=Variovorax sp. RHLX14 TaxID=1259731 RepID=UPI003F46C57A